MLQIFCGIYNCFNLHDTYVLLIVQSRLPVAQTSSSLNTYTCVHHVHLYTCVTEVLHLVAYTYNISVQLF